MTQGFTLFGFLDGSLTFSLLDKFKVNSPKQAQARFLKKYGAVLIGDWFIQVRNEKGEFVLDFPSTEQVELNINKFVKKRRHDAGATTK